MLFRLDPDSGVPFYQQVARQIKQMIATGALQPGDRLPTVRELASLLVLNPNTVAHAYSDLEREGVVETRRGQGTFACAPVSRLSEAERRRIIEALLEHALAEAFNLNISKAEVRRILDELIEGREREPRSPDREALAVKASSQGGEP